MLLKNLKKDKNLEILFGNRKKEDIILFSLPELFTLYQLQLSYAAVNFSQNSGTDQNFRRKILAKEWIEKTAIKEENVVSRNKAFMFKKK